MSPAVPYVPPCKILLQESLCREISFCITGTDTLLSLIRIGFISQLGVYLAVNDVTGYKSKTLSENASALGEGWSDPDPSFAALQQLE